MSYTTEWLIPQRVILCRVTGDITTDEAQQLADDMETHINAGIAPVHSIFDVSQMGKFPSSVSQINNMSRWVYHSSTGWVITLNASRVMSFLTVVVTNMARVKHRTAQSVDEAFKVLQRLDVSLTAPQP